MLFIVYGISSVKHDFLRQETDLSMFLNIRNYYYTCLFVLHVTLHRKLNNHIYLIIFCNAILTKDSIQLSNGIFQNVIQTINKLLFQYIFILV